MNEKKQDKIQQRLKVSVQKIFRTSLPNFVTGFMFGELIRNYINRYKSLFSNSYYCV